MLARAQIRLRAETGVCFVRGAYRWESGGTIGQKFELDYEETGARGHCCYLGKNDCLRAIPAYLLSSSLSRQTRRQSIASGVDDTVYRRNRHFRSVIGVTHRCEQ